MRFKKTRVFRWLFDQCRSAKSLVGLEGIDAKALCELDDMLRIRSLLSGYEISGGEVKQRRKMHICHLAAKRYRDENGVLWFGSHHPANLLIGFGTPNQQAGNRPYTAPDGKVIHPWRKADKEMTRDVKWSDIVKAIDVDAVTQFLASKPAMYQTKSLSVKQSYILAECGVLDIGLGAELERIKHWHSQPEVHEHIDLIQKDLRGLDGFCGSYQTEIFETVKEVRSRIRRKEITKLQGAKLIDQKGEELYRQGVIDENAIAWDVIWGKWDTLYDKLRDLALETDIPYDKEHAIAA
ncbi:hypothetical protein R7O12_03795 [Vibrio sp. Vb1574]|nr:hypothetical protein [Vibrio sp. Vb1574]